MNSSFNQAKRHWRLVAVLLCADVWVGWLAVQAPGWINDLIADLIAHL